MAKPTQKKAATSKKTKETLKTTNFLDEGLRTICKEQELPFSPALAKKFKGFEDDVISTLSFKSEHIVEIYKRAMVYVYTKTTKPKKGFLKGFNTAVFEKAVKLVKQWLEKTVKREEVTKKNEEEVVCNLYTMLR